MTMRRTTGDTHSLSGIRGGHKTTSSISKYSNKIDITIKLSMVVEAEQLLLAKLIRQIGPRRRQKSSVY
jgi:hypothetical protein